MILTKAYNMVFKNIKNILLTICTNLLLSLLTYMSFSQLIRLSTRTLFNNCIKNYYFLNIRFYQITYFHGISRLTGKIDILLPILTIFIVISIMIITIELVVWKIRSKVKK